MLKIDFANCLAERIGVHGLDTTSLDPASDMHRTMAELTRRLAASRSTPGDEGGGGGNAGAICPTASSAASMSARSRLRLRNAARASPPSKT